MFPAGNAVFFRLTGNLFSCRAYLELTERRSGGAAVEWFAWLPVLFFGMFLLVAGTILFQLCHGVRQWTQINGLPVLSVTARVVSKRTDPVGDTSPGRGYLSKSSYYATFEFPAGERRELELRENEFGSLTEGDVGTLTYQGACYKRFVLQTQTVASKHGTAA